MDRGVHRSPESNYTKASLLHTFILSLFPIGNKKLGFTGAFDT